MVSQSPNRGYIGLVGQSSSFASALNVALVCITWFVWQSTHSAIYVGSVAIVETLAVLLSSLPIGTFVDRLNKGTLLMVAGLLGLVALSILAFISVFFSFNIYLLLVIVAIWGVSQEAYRSTALSTIPDLVESGRLSRANGLYRGITRSVGSISSAAAGGLIVTLGVAAGFSYGAGAYLLSSIFAGLLIYPVYRLHHDTQSESTRERSGMLSDLKEGFSWLIGKKGFFLLTISATFFNFFLTWVITFLVVYAATGIHANSLTYGFLLAAYAAGDVTGSIVGGRLDLLKHSGKVNLLAFGGVPGACVLLMGLFPEAVAAVILAFIIGVSIGVMLNVWLTSAQNIVPKQMRGRYFALDGVLSSIGPVAIAIGALVISVVGITSAYVISGIMLLLFTLAFSMMKSLWSLDGRSRDEISVT